MNVYIFTKKESDIKKAFPKDTQFFSLTGISRHKPKDGSLSYIDVSGLTAAKIKKTLVDLKETCNKTLWGIVDPKGNVKDLAELFFEGACDYLGPAFFKKSKGIDSKRLKKALNWQKADSAGTAEEKKNEKPDFGFLKNKNKLPDANIFHGWKKIQSGKIMPFYVLYCSIMERTALVSRFGQKTYTQIHSRFISYLKNSFSQADGLLWMDTGNDCIFLVPPKAKCAEAAIEACIRMIVSTPLVTAETLDLSIPVNFIFALHYGLIAYKPPGKTGAVVSDAINFIFLLGAKKAEGGRLTISEDIPSVSITKDLEDCFIPGGEFEDRRIWHSRKFSYVKP